jgi:type II secretory pathway pseudopilin PulG
MNMRKQQNRNPEGFTLMEAMLAVVILGFAGAAVVLPFSSGAMVRAEGNRRTLAAKLAADLTEQIINTSYSSIPATYGDYQEARGKMKKADGTFFASAMYSNFSRKATCTYWPQDSRLILINVQVFYKGSEVALVARLIGK